jgi:hypothetical protein
MQKTNRKTLSLQRNTLRSLTGSEMADAQGGTLNTSILTRPSVAVCPPPTLTVIRTLRCSFADGCPTAPGPSDTIFPGGGF